MQVSSSCWEALLKPNPSFSLSLSLELSLSRALSLDSASGRPGASSAGVSCKTLTTDWIESLSATRHLLKGQKTFSIVFLF